MAMKPVVKKFLYYTHVAISRTLILGYKSVLSIKKARAKSLYVAKNKPTVAVIMCTWKRPDLIGMTLEHLDNQKLAKGQSIELYIWNNNLRIANKLSRRITSYTPTGSLLNVKLHNSLVNIGGFGRFYMARAIQSKYQHVIFIDDDESLPTDFISKAQKMQKPKTIASHWAFSMKTGYWDRTSVSGNQQANYCGTGGMVLDSSIFLNNELYACPLKYWFVEDLWLSLFAVNQGWKLRKLAVDITFIEDGNNQYESMLGKKADFYDYLVSRFGSAGPESHK